MKPLTIRNCGGPFWQFFQSKVYITTFSTKWFQENATRMHYKLIKRWGWHAPMDQLLICHVFNYSCPQFTLLLHGKCSNKENTSLESPRSFQSTSLLSSTLFSYMSCPLNQTMVPQKSLLWKIFKLQPTLASYVYPYPTHSKYQAKFDPKGDAFPERCLPSSNFIWQSLPHLT